jgi:Gas vesicle synthesis protein GvpL/GvpF
LPAVSAKRQADTRALGEILARFVVASKVREPTHEFDAVNLAILVEIARQEDLEEAVSALAHSWENRVTVRLLGPMAPYDFVISRAPGA